MHNTFLGKYFLFFLIALSDLCVFSRFSKSLTLNNQAIKLTCVNFTNTQKYYKIWQLVVIIKYDSTNSRDW